MDIEQFRSIILRNYIIFILVAVVLIFLLCVIRFNKFNDAEEEAKWQAKSKVELLGTKILVRVFLVVMIVLILIAYIVPISKDLKNITSNHYEEFMVEALHTSTTSTHPGLKYVDVTVLETDEEFRITYLGIDVPKGTVMVIQVYPNIKWGVIKEIISEPEPVTAPS